MRAYDNASPAGRNEGAGNASSEACADRAALRDMSGKPAPVR